MNPESLSFPEPEVTLPGGAPTEGTPVAKEIEATTEVALPQAEPVDGATRVTAIPTTLAPPSNLAAPTKTGTSFGRYVLIGEIARGGMGVVYKARQEGLERLVALKMILGAGVDHVTARRFLLEAQAAAALDHPNVVPVYDSGEIDGRPYFTMALIDGPNLRAYVTDRGPLRVEETVRVFAQIVAGVAHAHHHGIIHRDLKPANVLIDRDGRPRVTDFGLAKRSAANVNLTATGQMIGTPAYMAPEQARDSKEVGPPADVYALGAILYFLLTGRPPFEGENLTDLLIKVMTEEPIAPRVYQPYVSPQIEVICLRCLSKSPGDRPRDAGMLAEAFASAAAPYLPQSSGSGGSAASPTPDDLIPVEPSTVVTRWPQRSAILLPTPWSQVPGLFGRVARVAATVSAPSRRPLILGLCVATIGLVGVSLFLGSRRSNGPTPVDKVDGRATFGEITSDFPPATRGDFKLKVLFNAVAAKTGPEGMLTLPPDVAPQIHLQAERNCRVCVWSISPSGEVTRLIPNDDDLDDRLTAGVERVFPGNSRYKFNADPTEGAGVERLYVIATTGTPPVYPPGTKLERYAFYSTKKERTELATTVRGVSIKKPGPESADVGDVAEVEFKFRVQK